MIKDVHIYVKNVFLSTYIVLKSPGFAVIQGGKGSLTQRPLLATKLIVRGEQIRHNIYFFSSKEDHTYETEEIYQRVIAIRKSIKDRFTSKEDHTYVRGEIYQRVIAIRKSQKDRYYNGPKKDSKVTKGQTILKDL